MNTDIRLKVGFLDNQKVVKLQRRLGAEAVLSLIRLWIYAAENKPDGILDGFDSEDIEIICCWSHADGILPALLKLKLLEQIVGGFIIHDWEEHNPWAANAKSRSEQAKEAAKTRWDKERFKKQVVKPHADRMQCVYDEHAEGNAPFLTFPYLTLPTQYSCSSEFSKTWVEWEEYRIERKKKLTKASVKKQIKTLSELPVQSAIDCLNTSIQNGWTGIFVNKINTGEKRTGLLRKNGVK